MKQRESLAAVMTRFNAPIETRTYPLPERIADGDLLVRVDLAGMCAYFPLAREGYTPPAKQDVTW